MRRYLVVQRTRNHARMHSQPGSSAASKTPQDRDFVLHGYRTQLIAPIKGGGMP